ncbi:unnamed protein product [Brassica oleracea var. botrytis]|uniref:(rape) hypothetical protein n=1 Tax=Brassica napus TaxID=3708 RepID=A0A816K5T1_BRANA|nr:unnamed protein product [Brassica napus]
MDPKANESTKNNTPVSTDKLIPTQQSIMATEETIFTSSTTSLHRHSVHNMLLEPDIYVGVGQFYSNILHLRGD